MSLYTSEAEVVEIGMVRLFWVSLPYLLCGLMEVLGSVLRGCGYSITPMVVSLTGACGFRILWILTAFAWLHELPVLYLSYPISWALTALAHFICLVFAWKKLSKQQPQLS